MFYVLTNTYNVFDSCGCCGCWLSSNNICNTNYCLYAESGALHALHEIRILRWCDRHIHWRHFIDVKLTTTTIIITIKSRRHYCTNIFIYCVIRITCICSSNGHIWIGLWTLLWCHHYRYLIPWLQQRTYSSRREKNKSIKFKYILEKWIDRLSLPVSTSHSVLEFEFLWRHRNGDDNGEGCWFQWKIKSVIKFSSSCWVIESLTLLFVWQHVALMQPSSVVGQSSAQPSCDPFKFTLFDNPSTDNEKQNSE